MSKIRTAVVGLNMGLAHAHAYHLSDQSDLRWVVDLDEAKAAEIARELDCKFTTDWKQVLDDVDAISFATPHHLHAPMAMEAMRAGKHVLIEKPLANTEEDCIHLIKASEEQGVTLMVALIVRFRPHILRLKEAIETEEYGKPINANCWIGGYLKPAPDSWMSKKETLGGGVLFSHGCHYIDLLLSLLGKPVRATGLGTRLGTEWLEGEGTHHSVIQFESGALANLTSTWGVKYKEAPAWLHVHTTEACFLISREKLEVVSAEGRKILYEPAGQVDPKTAALAEVEHFLECIQSGRRPITDGYEALKSHRLIWSIYSQEGIAVNIDL